ncbi:MAG: DUF2784 domain-containing protein [Candidatus Sumerlaeota bacterium]|nr:DUF2784 domain-containing protein [Candidatus Sumerlaeota bacterium]
MFYGCLADTVVMLHFCFVLFAIFGGLLAFGWRRIVWVHVPVFIWAGLIEFGQWICPLTYLENWLREQGGEAAYTEGFVAHYIFPILYPIGLTPKNGALLGTLVFALNIAIYALLYRKWRKKPVEPNEPRDKQQTTNGHE